uniref:Uncharacterized protein n=1 Tax=uncultured marine group II/III euryarchaeote AD1000_118_H06 TaxID=1457722 RepID=A0A075FIX3_9EURY|nr:hypothetical protein [uncultured marine group II/III euryarchaeote AD1000_118_H06]
MDLHARKDQRAFLIDVLSSGEIGCWLAVATIGLMCLNRRGKEMFALKKYRDEESVIGGVAIADIGIIIEKGIALAEIRMILCHGSGLQMHAKYMNRHRLSHRQNLVR